MEYKNFGKFIRDKRESIQPKISQNGFANYNGIEPATLCRIELQKQDIKLSSLVKIAEGFDMKVSDLLKEYENSKYI